MTTSALKDINKHISIAVDGESAVGKGTLCKRISQEFNIVYCQSSIFYRKLASFLLRNNIDLMDISKFDINYDFFKKIDEDNIYTEEVTEKSSVIAQNSEVRSLLIDIQRDVFKKNDRVIMEGRDIGTVIFPNSMVKLYITADLNIRSQRRYLQYVNSGKKVILDRVRESLFLRDKRDKERNEAPLTQANDAIIIDNSNMNLEEFYAKALCEIESKLKKI